MDFYSVGHSTHKVGRLIELLQHNGVTAIADVRSRPFSRMNPQFNRDALKKTLSAEGIAYSFLGSELGARPSDPSCYDKGRARYDLITRTELFHQGILRLEEGSLRYRVALMCAEKDPMTCHRSLLVCRELVRRGYGANHILANGEVETQSDGLRRVAAEVRVSFTDLFREERDVVAEVYARRINQIEYVESAHEESA